MKQRKQEEKIKSLRKICYSEVFQKVKRAQGEGISSSKNMKEWRRKKAKRKFKRL
jgi:hypothetical protein